MLVTDFLKKYTTIDHKFIDDFFSFYDEEKSEYEFVIDLEKIASWLNVTKKNLKELLVNNFKENDDYVQINVPKLKVRGGHNNMKVYLTYDCFKMLSMISQAQKSDEVRKYYIDIEKHLLIYRNEIIDDLQKQIGIKTKNKKIIEQNDKYSLIYILRVDPNSDIFKIGKTKEIKKRMSAYKVGNTKEYEIMYVMKIKSNILSDVENCIKKNLDENTYRISSDEIIKLDYKRIIETINYCNEKHTHYLYASNNKKTSKNANWMVVFDNDEDNIIFYENIKKNIRPLIKQKKITKRGNKKISKKTSKKSSKKSNKKSSKKRSKRSKIQSRTRSKASKKINKKIIRKKSNTNTNAINKIGTKPIIKSKLRSRSKT